VGGGGGISGEGSVEVLERDWYETERQIRSVENGDGGEGTLMRDKRRKNKPASRLDPK